MKRRGIAILLIVLLCASLLLSGALLILHAEHECRRETCPVCTVLADNREFALSLTAAFAGIGFLLRPEKEWLYALAENRFLPDWTPVRRKVKLQD